MAKTIFQLSYSYGPNDLDARVSKMGADKFVLIAEERGRTQFSNTMTAAEFEAFWEELHELYEHPEHDFNSVFCLHDFAEFGRFDVDEHDRHLARHYA